MCGRSSGGGSLPLIAHLIPDRPPPPQVRKGFSTWVAYAAVLGLKRRKMRSALLTMGGSKLRKGFNSLAANAQRKPSPMLRGAAYFVNRKLAAAWMSWRAYSNEIMRLRRAASGLVHGPKRKVWNRWEIFAYEARLAAAVSRQTGAITPACTPLHSFLLPFCRSPGRRVATASEARFRRDAREGRLQGVEPLA